MKHQIWQYILLACCILVTSCGHSSIFPFWFAAILFASAKVLFLSLKTNKYLNNLAFFIDYHFRVPLFIDTQQDPQMQLFSQLMEGTLKKLERYCATARPMLGGEVYLTGEEVCKLLRLSTRTLQEYRNSVTLPFYKIGGKILYKQSDIQAMLERHYNPIPKKLWQV